MDKNTLTPYEKVLTARKQDRPNITEYIEALFDDFIEMHGDRLYRDDKSIVGGIGLFHGMPVTVIGHRKGKNTEDNILYNFGMTSPEGYRKAVRLMEQAEKFDWPDPEAPESGTEFCHGLRQQLAVLCDGTAVPCRAYHLVKEEL